MIWDLCAYFCGSVGWLSFPLDLEIALVDKYGGAANLFDLAIHARQLVQHDLEHVAIIFVRASEGVQPVREDSVTERQIHLTALEVRCNPIEASGEAVCDFA